MKSKKDAEKIAAAVVHWFRDVFPFEYTEEDAELITRRDGAELYRKPGETAERIAGDVLRACRDAELKETAPELYAAGLSVCDMVLNYAENGRL